MTLLTESEKRKRERAWTKFFLSTGVVVVLFTLGIFIALLVRNNHLINNELKIRAKAHIEHIMITRAWNAHYGGVYVEKRPGVESNPYLENPDIKADDGKVFTLKNPALMTREISELFGRDRQLSFSMTSENPLNPGNAPDKFEDSALTAFENGNVEMFEKESVNGSTNFRYMVPLFVHDSCLECHVSQGYQLGDLRGGISVQFDISDIEETLKLNKQIIVSLGILSSVTLLGIIYSLTFVLMKRLDRAQQKIQKMAVTDELTGLYNRRYFFERINEEIKRAKRFRQSLGCIILDIDLFKKVNDKHGHQAGDMILKKVAQTVKGCCREIDTVSRYGGEEIIILLPGTDSAGAAHVAGKMREAVENMVNVYEQDVNIPVTVSLGTVSFSDHELKNVVCSEQIIKCADEALYSAKEKGRNRVEISDAVLA